MKTNDNKIVSNYFPPGACAAGGGAIVGVTRLRRGDDCGAPGGPACGDSRPHKNQFLENSSLLFGEFKQ